MYEIKKSPKDFKVEEVTAPGEVLESNKEHSFDSKPKGDYLICRLVKRDWEQNRAIREISNRMHISRRRIGYAGTKDKRALTSQRISIRKAKPKHVENLKIKDMEITPLEFSDESISLGDLWGNRFTIKIETDEKLREVPERVPNYFGHQRFGKIRPITHLVGKAILNKDPEKAVKIYLAKVFPDESEDAKKAREWLKENWEEKPFKEALKRYPKYLGYERTMLHHLAEYPRDFINALRELPRNLEIMFIHAYQSDLFNQYLDKVKDKDLDQDEGPVYGYGTELRNKYEEGVLEENGVSLEDFKNPLMPEMSSEGKRRKLFIDLEDFEVLEEGDGFYVVGFSLPKGSYATVVIDNLFEGG